jgi:hypothetical protein
MTEVKVIFFFVPLSQMPMRVIFILLFLIFLLDVLIFGMNLFNLLIFLPFIFYFVACKFESKWKSFSRKFPRKRIDDDQMKQSRKDSHRLLQHRKTALDRVKGSFDLSHLEIDWKLNTF